MKYLSLILFASVLLNCDSIFDFKDESYPATINKIDAKKQNQLLNTLTKDLKNCGSVSDYGFLFKKNSFNCHLGASYSSAGNQIDQVIRAKSVLVRNSKTTGVNNPDKLILKKTSFNPKYWQIDFENQIFKGLEVINTGFSLRMDPNKVFSIYGHWYNNIVIPGKDNYSITDVKKKLLGYEHTYICWRTNTFIVTQQRIDNALIRKVIRPTFGKDKIYMMVVWEIRFKSEGFTFYVDTTTGDLSGGMNFLC
ncbi:MAG: hypothetical protein JXR20_07830 [Balneola sp.]